MTLNTTFLFLQEQLDEAEFGKGAAGLEYDEDVTNSAAELGLLVGNQCFSLK